MREIRRGIFYTQNRSSTTELWKHATAIWRKDLALLTWPHVSHGKSLDSQPSHSVLNLLCSFGADVHRNHLLTEKQITVLRGRGPQPSQPYLRPIHFKSITFQNMPSTTSFRWARSMGDNRPGCWKDFPRANLGWPCGLYMAFCHKIGEGEGC